MFEKRKELEQIGKFKKVVVGALFFALTSSFNLFSQTPSPVRGRKPVKISQQDSLVRDIESVEIIDNEILEQVISGTDTIVSFDADTIVVVDTLGEMELLSDTISTDDDWQEREVAFNPDPTRAVWLSALFPGLGQIYNRRYWKLPIVVGGFMGLGYATSWNNGMLRDYTQAYSDIMDTDPSTNSYMDFFPSTIKEETLDKTWLTNVLKSRKDFYRRNRDLCIIGMVGVYFLAMLDAYVDASLAHFDISPDLSMDVAPAVIPESRYKLPAVGIQWAINF